MKDRIRDAITRFPGPPIQLRWRDGRCWKCSLVADNRANRATRCHPSVSPKNCMASRIASTTLRTVATTVGAVGGVIAGGVYGAMEESAKYAYVNGTVCGNEMDWRIVRDRRYREPELKEQILRLVSIPVFFIKGAVEGAAGCGKGMYDLCDSLPGVTVNPLICTQCNNPIGSPGCSLECDHDFNPQPR